MTRSKIRVVAGAASIVVGLLASRGVLETLASDGQIESPVVRLAIAVFRIGCIALGAAILADLERTIARRLVRSRVLLVLSSTVVTIVAVEIVLRVALGPVWSWAPPERIWVGERENRPSETFMADSLLGWRMWPGESFTWTIDGRDQDYTANGAGFRTPYEMDEAAGNGPVVVVVGDSFAFGTGVAADATFTHLLDEGLGDAMVYNLALPGFGIDQMWMTVRHAALPMAPDVIVVAFIDNDLDRSLSAYRETEGMNKPAFIFEAGELRPQTLDDRPTVSRHLPSSAIVGLLRSVGRARAMRTGQGTWWTLNAAVFDQIVEDASAADVEVVFVRLPLRQGRSLPALTEFMASREYVFLDLGVDVPEGLHFRTDDHIDEAGHHHVADQLLPTLRALLR